MMTVRISPRGKWSKAMRVSGVFFGLAAVLAASVAQADDFPAGDMHDKVSQACTQCHAADVVVSQHKSRDDWAQTVTTMISNGANITDADYDKTVDYLAKSFPAK
jgi:Zn-dependent alcohol dehydrogenase